MAAAAVLVTVYQVATTRGAGKKRATTTVWTLSDPARPAPRPADLLPPWYDWAHAEWHVLGPWEYRTSPTSAQWAPTRPVKPPPFLQQRRAYGRVAQRRADAPLPPRPRSGDDDANPTPNDVNDDDQRYQLVTLRVEQNQRRGEPELAAAAALADPLNTTCGMVVVPARGGGLRLDDADAAADAADAANSNFDDDSFHGLGGFIPDPPREFGPTALEPEDPPPFTRPDGSGAPSLDRYIALGPCVLDGSNVAPHYCVWLSTWAPASDWSYAASFAGPWRPTVQPSSAVRRRALSCLALLLPPSLVPGSAGAGAGSSAAISVGDGMLVAAGDAARSKAEALLSATPVAVRASPLRRPPPQEQQQKQLDSEPSTPPAAVAALAAADETDETLAQTPPPPPPPLALDPGMEQHSAYDAEPLGGAPTVDGPSQPPPAPREWVLADVDVAAPVDAVVGWLWAPESAFFVALCDARGYTNVEVSAWSRELGGDGHGDASSAAVRTVAYVMPKSALIKATPATETQTLTFAAAGRGAVAECVQRAPGLPFGSDFQTAVQFVVTPDAAGDPAKCRLRISLELVFVKKTLAKGMIRSGAKKPSQEAMDLLVTELKQYAAQQRQLPPATRSPPKPQFAAATPAADDAVSVATHVDPRLFASLSPALDQANKQSADAAAAAATLSANRASRVTFAPSSFGDGPGGSLGAAGAAAAAGGGTPRERSSTLRGPMRARTASSTGVIPDLRPAGARGMLTDSEVASWREVIANASDEPDGFYHLGGVVRLLFHESRDMLALLRQLLKYLAVSAAEAGPCDPMRDKAAVMAADLRRRLPTLLATLDDGARALAYSPLQDRLAREYQTTMHARVQSLYHAFHPEIARLVADADHPELLEVLSALQDELMFKCMWSNNIARAIASGNADIVRDTLGQFRECPRADLFGAAFVAAKTASLTECLEQLHVTQLLAALASEDPSDARLAVRHLHADGLAQSPEAAVAAAERAAALFAAQAQALARRWLLREAEAAFGPLTSMHALNGNSDTVSLAGSIANVPATPPRAAQAAAQGKGGARQQPPAQHPPQPPQYNNVTPSPRAAQSPSRRWGSLLGGYGELPPNSDYYT